VRVQLTPQMGTQPLQQGRLLAPGPQTPPLGLMLAPSVWRQQGRSP